jgi:hypothetical protein
MLPTHYPLRGNSRDAYAADYVGSTREFLFMSLPSLRLELDLTLLLLGLAVKSREVCSLLTTHSTPTTPFLKPSHH